MTLKGVLRHALASFGLSIAQVPSPAATTGDAAQFIEGLKKGEVPQATLRGVLPDTAFFKDCSRLSKDAFSLCREKNPQKLSELARILSDSLSRTGYGEQSWYFTLGFGANSSANSLVVFTQVEQIQSNGRPRTGSTRWNLTYSSPEIDSFKTFVETLLTGAPAGRYRFFLFGFSRPEKTLTNTGVMWMSASVQLVLQLEKLRNTARNASRLPLVNSLEDFPASGVRCQVFVYEYEISPTDGSVKFLQDINGLSVEDHLKGAGIWQALGLEHKP